MSYPTTNISFQLAAKSSSWWGSGYQASSYLPVLSFIFNKCMRVIPLDNCTDCIWLDTYIHFPVLIGNVKEIIAQSTQNQDGYMRMFDNISQYMFRSQAAFSANEIWLHKMSWTLVKCFWSGWMFLRKPWCGWRLGVSSRGTPRKALMRERFSSKCCWVTIFWKSVIRQTIKTWYVEYFVQ